MRRAISVTCALVALVLLASAGTAADKGAGKAKKNQMVKGTIKTIDPSTNLLIVNQKLKDEVVDRQLNISDTTEWDITVGGEKKQFFGKDGLIFLTGKEGATVAVKCDKDVNVLKVTVNLKK